MNRNEQGGKMMKGNEGWQRTRRYGREEIEMKAKAEGREANKMEWKRRDQEVKLEDRRKINFAAGK